MKGLNLSPAWRMIKVEAEKEVVKLLEELFSEMKLITKWQKEFGDKAVKLALILRN